MNGDIKTSFQQKLFTAQCLCNNKDTLDLIYKESFYKIFKP